EERDGVGGARDGARRRCGGAGAGEQVGGEELADRRRQGGGGGGEGHVRGVDESGCARAVRGGEWCQAHEKTPRGGCLAGGRSLLYRWQLSSRSPIAQW